MTYKDGTDVVLFRLQGTSAGTLDLASNRGWIMALARLLAGGLIVCPAAMLLHCFLLQLPSSQLPLLR